MVRSAVVLLLACLLGGCAQYIPHITQGMSDVDAQAELKKGWPPALLFDVTKLPDGNLKETYKQDLGNVGSYIIIEWGDEDVESVTYTAF